ncbi:hypothetical protein PAPYR_2411 [Paratrimastix pyriformis]|uniref:Uncharacterized protein n=1 Tax=Paratrimastix pyriformis TaxID=342808 RepID=A0ABQ8UX57_9EUKA|nr:hypothetical protein PAPYR_2411 [Paratrimastix pyriformis]
MQKREASPKKGVPQPAPKKALQQKRQAPNRGAPLTGGDDDDDALVSLSKKLRPTTEEESLVAEASVSEVSSAEDEESTPQATTTAAPAAAPKLAKQKARLAQLRARRKEKRSQEIHARVSRDEGIAFASLDDQARFLVDQCSRTRSSLAHPTQTAPADGAAAKKATPALEISPEMLCTFPENPESPQEHPLPSLATLLDTLLPGWHQRRPAPPGEAKPKKARAAKKKEKGKLADEEDGKEAEGDDHSEDEEQPRVVEPAQIPILLVCSNVTRVRDVAEALVEASRARLAISKPKKGGPTAIKGVPLPKQTIREGLAVVQLVGRHLKGQHLDVAKQAAHLRKGGATIAVGTPSRLLQMVVSGAISMNASSFVVVDLAHDSKKRNIFEYPETQKDLVKLIAEHFLPAQTQPNPPRLLLL